MKAPSLVAAAAVGACLGLSLGIIAGPARAQEATAPALGSYVLKAASSGAEIILGGQIDATVPDATSTFDTGGLGYARSSIVWPGGIAGNFGDTLFLLTGGAVPKEIQPLAQQLNYPIRAESRSPSGPASASFGTVPGIEMSSSAGATGSQATTTVAATQNPGLVTLGNVHAKTKTGLVGAEAVSEASSAVEDISIVGGLVRIGSITSVANARSDGKQGTGTASTIVAGVSITGVPVAIDETGLRLGTGSNPLNETLSAIVDQALQQAGISVVVSKATMERNGPTFVAGAESVLITVAGQAALHFGGVSATASASPVFEAGSADQGGTSTPGPASSAPPDSFVGGSSDLSISGGGTPVPARARVSGPTTLPPLEAVSFFGLANPMWMAILGAAASAPAALGLRRLGSTILDTPTTCSQGGRP